MESKDAVALKKEELEDTLEVKATEKAKQTGQAEESVTVTKAAEVVTAVSEEVCCCLLKL